MWYRCYLFLALCIFGISCHGESLDGKLRQESSFKWTFSDRLTGAGLTLLGLTAGIWVGHRRDKRNVQQRHPEHAPTGTGTSLTQSLQKFENITKQLAKDSQPETLEEALSFVRTLCGGISPLHCSAEVVTGSGAATLVVRSASELFGEFATRSRIPFNIAGDREIKFQIETKAPASTCPFNCACHLRCFGPASCSKDGCPLGGPWAELVLVCGTRVQRISAATQVFAQHSPVDFGKAQGPRVVHVPQNDTSSVDMRGAVAVFAEKHKPGTMSDGALLKQAFLAGALAVIKIGGGGAMLYSVPDPSEIPCFAISEEDGKTLTQALAQGPVHLKQCQLHDKRARLQQDRWSSGNVWVHIDGLFLQSVDWGCPLSEVAEETQASRQVLVYEDYFNVYKSTRDADPRLSPERSKLRRMIESAWVQLGRVGLASNASMMGKLLAIGAQRCKFKVQYVKFFPAKSFKGTACAMLLSPEGPSCTQRPACSTIVQAWVAHEAVYLALMGHFTKLIGYMAPSLWNFIQCINGEFFGWEADAKQIRKLFTACSGPVGPIPQKEWQQLDPTWRIVDERNSLGIVTRTQGRLLWTRAQPNAPNAPAEPRHSRPRRVRQEPKEASLSVVGRMCHSLCSN